MPEIEAKFILERREQLTEVLQTLQLLGYSVKKGPTQAIVDRYFDTADWLIFKAGWAYRLRQRGGQEKLTLKALDVGKGPVFVREEIDQPLARVGTDGGTLPPGPVRERLDSIVNGNARQQLFCVRNRRTIYEVAAPDEAATTIELGVDRAEIVIDDNRSQPLTFTELEFELQHGDCDRINELAVVLCEKIGLVSAQLSKFERGLQATNSAHPAEVKAEQRPKLSRKSPMLDLAYAHLGRNVRALRLQAPRAWEGIDPEGVHQMRIAIRRIRAAIRVFRPLLPMDEIKRFNRQFRWLARALGDIRDIDVYDENFHDYLAALPEADARALDRYEAHLQALRREARVNLLAVLGSDRYRRLVGDFHRFIVRGPSAGRRRRFGDVTIGYGADAYIEKAVARLLKRGRRIDADSPDAELHKLRIQGKRVRYLMELFHSFCGDRLIKTIKACRRLQNVLGEHQDAIVASERLRAYAESLPVVEDHRLELLALGRLVQSQSQHAAAARARFPSTWRRFERACKGL